MVGDVQAQLQPWRVRTRGLQRGFEAAPGDVAVAVVGGAGHCQAVEPGFAVGADDAQGEVGVALEFRAQLVFMGRQVAGLAGGAEDAAEHLGLAVQQLAVELDEVGFAGAVEEHAGDQRDGGGAGGEQQAEAGAEGQAAHQASRASST